MESKQKYTLHKASRLRAIRYTGPLQKDQKDPINYEYVPVNGHVRPILLLGIIIFTQDKYKPV